MRNFVKVALSVIVMTLGMSAVSLAAAPLPAPEIDPSSGLAALTVVLGATLIIRARSKNRNEKQ